MRLDANHSVPIATDWFVGMCCAGGDAGAAVVVVEGAGTECSGCDGGGGGGCCCCCCCCCFIHLATGPGGVAPMAMASVTENGREEDVEEYVAGFWMAADRVAWGTWAAAVAAAAAEAAWR